MTERADNAIKFLSDMFYARAYRLAAVKVGAGDYRSLVDQKLRIAGELYEFMVNEFREARGFFLELLVIVILIIELSPSSAGDDSSLIVAAGYFSLRSSAGRP